MDKKVIIFDFDNTLVNSLKYWLKVLDKELFIKYGKKPDKQMATLRVGTTNREMADIFMRLAGISVPYDEIRAGWNALMENYYLTKVKMIKYAKDFLLQLKKEGKTIAIASATEELLLTKVLDHFGINIFDHILTEFNLDAPKHKPEFFDKLTEKLNVSASEIIFFEDSYSSIKNATSKGLECYALIHKFNKKHKDELEKICTKTLKNYKKLAKN